MCAYCDHSEHLNHIEMLIDSGDYDDAKVEFLDNIGEWVRENNHITDKQIEAIENIESSIYD